MQTIVWVLHSLSNPASDMAPIAWILAAACIQWTMILTFAAWHLGFVMRIQEECATFFGGVWGRLSFAALRGFHEASLLGLSSFGVGTLVLLFFLFSGIPEETTCFWESTRKPPIVGVPF